MTLIDTFISHLYRATKRIDIEHYRKWALNEVQEFLNIDAAIWSTGHLSTRTFHTHTTLNLPTDFPDKLIENIKINPISNKLFARAGKAVDMSEAIDDDAFYNSEIYKTVFAPQNIKRILSSIHIDSRSGIYTLLSVYRNQRKNIFTDDEKDKHQRILFHLIEAASHSCMLGLEDKSDGQLHYYAICDRHGIYHEVENEFLDIIETLFPTEEKQTFPVKIPLPNNTQTHEGYVFSTVPLGDLYRVKLRPKNKLDALTERELEVVEGVTKGLSFKLIAKQLGLSPSTVSNHLYRIYHKLNISSRAELAILIDHNSTN